MRRDKKRGPIVKDLGDGLVLRRGTAADAERIAEFNGGMHIEDEPDVGPGLTAWTRDLMSGRHPTMRPQNFTFVEDTRTGAVVSSLCLIPQTWSYEGIPFKVGLPELVGTKPEYRRRGLIRAQFDVIHRWSARSGHMLQGIGGIPNFYRQFGYEMAVDTEGSRTCLRADVPALKRGEREPYRLRRMKDADIPFVARVYREGMKRYLLSCVRTPALWRYDLTGRSKQAILRRDLRIIETRTGERVGFLAEPTGLWGDRFGVVSYELVPEASWLSVTPSVMRQVARDGDRHAARENKDFRRFAFWLDVEHPAYEVLPWKLSRKRDPWALYIRVPDVPAFLRGIGPVLERRLSESVAVGYTGELKLSFYRDGVRVSFERGRLVEADGWRPEGGASAAFPDLTFLQLLFGRRSLEELRSIYPDCHARNEDAAVLLPILFAKKASSVWTVT